MARLPNFLVIIRSEKLSGKGQGRGGRGAKKRTFRFGKKNVSFPKVETFRFADYRTTARPVLLLYYVLRSPETPSSDKMLIVAALSYLVLPIDLISAKRLPIIGWIDEAVSLVYAYKKVCRYVTPEIESEVDNILERWFPEGKYELIEE